MSGGLRMEDGDMFVIFWRVEFLGDLAQHGV